MRFVFRCDGDLNSGFGHLSRCLSLARTLRELASVELLFVGAYGEFGRRMLEEYGVPFAAIGDRETVADSLRPYVAQASCLIVDTYELQQLDVDELNCGRAPTVYFVDTPGLDYVGASGIVSVRLSSEHLPMLAGGWICSGAEALITKPELVDVRNANAGRKFETIKRVLMFFSGAPNVDNIVKRSILALDVIGAEFQVVVVTAAPILGLDDLRHITVVPREPVLQFERLLAEADAVVCGGGLLKYEAAYCGLPTAVSSVTPLQQADTELLAVRGIVLDLGLAASPSSAFEATAAAFVLNAGLRRQLAKAATAAFATDATRHLAGELLRLGKEGAAR